MKRSGGLDRWLLHLDSYNFCRERRPVVASLRARTVYTYQFVTLDLTFE
jgi:hypothetical protein